MNDLKATQARAELQALANRAANTSEARFRVLEAIDRYVRLTTERTTDIRKARNIVGTCPDMCPEKERYLREWKSMVPSFERHPSNNQIDHTRAIKQYSRSSADQELPLAHELRTENALGSTMYFLLANHADRIDGPTEEQGAGNVSDWFHYIWDRTRGIRKDITQQDLCSRTVVELVQQCARFHIHCAARHCNEDPSIFDQQINTENLTKCLQTLKYMYADLKQQGIQCPDEAEFRAYMMLLYLNEGSFQTELRGLTAAIIHSSEVKFALSVHQALVRNDYVRFFKMVRQASYMNACILLRYFTQIRLTALNVIRKAYALRSTATFKLDYLTNILGFDDEADAVEFFEHVGVLVDSANERVLFEVRHVAHDFQPFAAKRSLQLVESKRMCSVGEAICGVPLHQWGAQFPPVPCVTSFDAHGFLQRSILQEAFGRREIEIEQEAQPVNNVQHLVEESFGYREMDVEMEEVPPIIDDEVANDGHQLDEVFDRQEITIEQVTSNGRQGSFKELYRSSGAMDVLRIDSLESISGTDLTDDSDGANKQNIDVPLQTDTAGQRSFGSIDDTLSAVSSGSFVLSEDSDGANKQNIDVSLQTHTASQPGFGSSEATLSAVSSDSFVPNEDSDGANKQIIDLTSEEGRSAELYGPSGAKIGRAHTSLSMSWGSAQTLNLDVESNPTADTFTSPALSKDDSHMSWRAAGSDLAFSHDSIPFSGFFSSNYTSNITPDEMASQSDSTTTMAYVSPPASTQIARAGKKRTFFGAFKAVTDGWSLETPSSQVCSYNSEHVDREGQMARNGQQELAMGGQETGLQQVPHQPHTLVWKPVTRFSPSLGASSVIDSGAEFRLPCNIFDPKPQQQDLQRTWKAAPASSEHHESSSNTEHREPSSNTGAVAVDVEYAESEVSDQDQLCEREEDNIPEEEVSDTPDVAATEQDNPELALVDNFPVKRANYLMKKYTVIWLANVRSKLNRRRMARQTPPQIWHKKLPPVSSLGSLLRLRNPQPSQQSIRNIRMDPVVRRRLLLFETFPSSELIDPFELLCDVVRKKLKQEFRTLRSAQPLLWKLVISVPSVRDSNSRPNGEGFVAFLERWLSQCSFARKSSQEVPNNKHFFLEARANPMFDCWLRRSAICMRLVRGEEEPRDESEGSPLGACKLANGIVFFLDSCTTLRSVRERLENFLAHRGIVKPTIVLLYYTPRGEDRSTDDYVATINAALNFLDSLGISYQVFAWRDPSKNAVLRDALRFLASAYCKQLQELSNTENSVQMLPTIEYMHRCMGRELWHRFKMTNRTLLARPANNAEAIIQAYRSGIFRMIDMVDKNHLKQYIRVPEDFDPVRMLWRRGVTLTTIEEHLPEGFFAPNWQDQPFVKLQGMMAFLDLHRIPSKLQDAINRMALEATRYCLGVDTNELTEQLRSYLALYSEHLSASTQAELVDHLRTGIVLQLAGIDYRLYTRPPVESSSEESSPARVLYWFPLLSSIAMELLGAVCAKAELPLEAYFVRGELATHMNKIWWKDENNSWSYGAAM